MNVLVIGGGGREHALTWKLAQSPQVKNVYCCPGNGGTAEEGTNVAIDPGDFSAVAEFVRKSDIDLTVVGPETHLVNGISDYFTKRGLPIFGPGHRGAQIEGSKVFSKELFEKYKIPSGRFQVFENNTQNDIDAVRSFVQEHEWARVLKADGLAAGKGVLVCETEEDVNAAIETLMIRKAFGPAGDRIVVEEKLVGEEVSMLCFMDGQSYLPMLPSQDYKQIYEGDKGPNTGGMGAYAPVPFVNEKIIERICTEIFEPTLQGFQQDNIDYKGILYAGVMITDEGPKILEYNCRFGDPEAQPILFMLDSDLVDVIMHVLNGTLKDATLNWRTGYAACIVMVSDGYPGAYQSGREVQGLPAVEKITDGKVFQAGTKMVDDRIITSGGRVLGVTATAESLQHALDLAYEGVALIDFDNKYFRPDIGFRALRHG